MSRFVRVAVPVPLHRPFTYILPEGLNVRPGLRVEVRFGPRKVIGMVCGDPSPTPPSDVSVSKLKKVIEKINFFTEIFEMQKSSKLS